MQSTSQIIVTQVFSSIFYTRTPSNTSSMTAVRYTAKCPDSRFAASLFFVTDAPASLVVTVLVCAATVVPGMVLTGSVVTRLTVLPAETVDIVVIAGTTLGGIVVLGIVVVYVIS